MAASGTAAARPAASEPAVAAGRGNVGRIPIRNLWLLMLYASRLYRELPPARRVAVEDNPDEIPDLVAQLLTRAVERRLRRNLSFAFQETSANLRRVRGRIDLLRTERRHLLRRGRVACRYEELTVDTPRNRYVRAAAQKLVKVVGAADLLSRCRAAGARLEAAGVSSDPALASPRGRSSAAADLRGRIVLESRDRRIIIDTKFTSIVASGHYGKETFHSGHLYQIYAYLRSQERPDDPRSLATTGMLLHPSVRGNVYEAAVIQGHELRFATVDLAASSRTIRERLLQVVTGSPFDRE